MRDRRITKPGFRPCSACPPRSQAPFCLCTQRTITNRAEGTFGSLRYRLGGDRPSQTAHQALSSRIHSAELEPNGTKGGISPVAPPQPEPGLRSLPPILRMVPPDSIPGCSKAARGLSVPWRVTGVFTGTTSSPSPWLRQCSSRYTIRAGRNLPDKEFRSHASRPFSLVWTISSSSLSDFLQDRPCFCPIRTIHGQRDFDNLD